MEDEKHIVCPFGTSGPLTVRMHLSLIKLSHGPDRKLLCREAVKRTGLGCFRVKLSVEGTNRLVEIGTKLMLAYVKARRL